MTKQEKIIVSAYTGTLMCDFRDVHEYIEKKLGRPVYTHELVDKNFWEEIKEKLKEDFLEICKQEKPEIIRCEDCKWWDRKFDDSPIGYCMAAKHNYYSRHWEINIQRTYGKNFFCADAEPKEEVRVSDQKENGV